MKDGAMWLVVLGIAVFVLPRILGQLFSGAGRGAYGTAQLAVNLDPTAAADANLAAAINQIGGYGWSING